MEKRVSKLSISADDLERRENLAKRLNRNAKNRLRQQHEQFQDNHEFIESEINQEIRKLQDDLKGIREIGNHDVKNSTHERHEHKNANNPNNGYIKRKRNKNLTLRFQKKTNSRRSLHRNETDKKVKIYSSQLISVEKITAVNSLVNLSRVEKPVQKNTQTRNSAHEIRFSKHAVRFDENEVQLKQHQTRLYEHEVVGHEKHEPLPRITQSPTQESKSRVHEEKLDVHEARNQARKRLLGDDETDSNTQNEGEGTRGDDIESYMYVPPDGRKRTVYLLPPLEELLQEAKKARYLRIPKRLMTYEDDPERELSVDEIFSKSV